MLDLSVIICTHNPRPDYLNQVLEALKMQTVPRTQWELLLIDNASKQPLASTWLSWHVQGRLIREEELGLTAARLRGIRESTGDLIVFVDDDNVLCPDYLEQCLGFAGKYSFIGAWGGQVIPDFEIEPSKEATPFLRYLFIRRLEEVKWSNLIDFYETTPSGAGMCLRRAVAREYLLAVASDPRRKELDRKGESIFAGGDTDMALCTRRIGLGMALFPSLKVTHLIPKSRLVGEFFLKASFGFGYTHTLLTYLYLARKRPQKVGALRRSVRFLRLLGRSSFERRMAGEQQKGESLAWKLIEKWERAEASPADGRNIPS